jgi:ferritin-like metal-binding protein YciE
MPALRSPEDLLATELKGIHSAERQLSRALPRFSKKIQTPRLREMLDERREQGAILIERIEDALEEMQVAKARQKNIAAEALIEDMTQHIEESENETLVEPLLLASIQKIEHYCIAAWGTAAAMGRLLGQENVVETMEQVLEQGKRFDEEMTKLAEEEVNPRMLDDGESMEMADQQEAGQKNAGSGRGSRQSASKGSEADLKKREYRDEKGQAHHHTRTYTEQHGKK